MSRCVFMNPHVWPLKIFSASEIYDALDDVFANTTTDADGYTVVEWNSKGTANIKKEADLKFRAPSNVGKYKMVEADEDVGDCVEIYAKEGKQTEAFFQLVPKGEYIRSSRYLSALVYTDGEKDSYFEFYLNSEGDLPTVADKCSPFVESATLKKGQWHHLLFDLDKMSAEFKKHNDMRTLKCLRCDFANVGGSANFTNEYAKIKYIGFFRTRELAEDYYNQIMGIKESE